MHSVPKVDSHSSYVKQVMKMQNVIIMTDELGSVVSLNNLEKSLSNLGRFCHDKAEIRTQVEALSLQNSSELQEFSKDFYTTWYASSTELASAIGLEECLEYFDLFRSNYWVTWPNDALDFMQRVGPGAELKIFRGESPSLVAQGIQGISWTTDRSIAEYYANRHSDGVILVGTTTMKNVLIYLEEEKEVVVRTTNVKIINAEA